MAKHGIKNGEKVAVLCAPADAVYLARWSDAPVSRSGIQDNLPKIKSKRARVAECLTRVAPVG